jgi:hypothetical protein
LTTADQRTASTSIFSAICPGDGKGAALVLPACDTEAMNVHLAEIAAEVAPGKQSRARRRQAGRQVLSPKCWISWLSNRVFASCTHLVDHSCEAWNKLASATGQMGSDQRQLI